MNETLTVEERGDLIAFSAEIGEEVARLASEVISPLTREARGRGFCPGQRDYDSLQRNFQLIARESRQFSIECSALKFFFFTQKLIPALEGFCAKNKEENCGWVESG